MQWYTKLKQEPMKKKNEQVVHNSVGGGGGELWVQLFLEASQGANKHSLNKT